MSEPSGARSRGASQVRLLRRSVQMRARHTRALALLLAACSLSVTACGGGGRGKASAAAEAQAAGRWRSGLIAWHHRMLHALDEISLLLSTQEGMAMLGEPHSRAQVMLGRFELTLADCSATVERLGPEPSDLASARQYALAACASLERGDRLVETALHGLSSGEVGDVESATAPLSDGQSEMAVATQTLQPGSDKGASSG